MWFSLIENDTHRHTTYFNLKKNSRFVSDNHSRVTPEKRRINHVSVQCS